MGSAETVHPKALMGQGVHRTQAEDHPTTPLETAEGLKQLLGLGFDQIWGRNEKNIGIFGNGWQFPISYSARQQCHKVCLCSHLHCSVL